MLVGEAADDIVAIDDAMKLGYNWKFGTVRADRTAWGRASWPRGSRPRVGRCRRSWQRWRPPLYRIEDGKRQYWTLAGDYADVVRPAGVLLLEDIKLRGKPLAKTGSAALWDIGDGVVALEFTAR